tara:strand:- start:45 stop:611 length:567 start_codon:yes stop_codon:yes gene_type:complete
MYAKINGGTVVKFPYSVGQLRKDNSNVSFPKNITQGIMQRYGMVGVLEGPKPGTTAYQTVQRNALPTRPVIGQYTEETAPMSDMVGDDIIAGYWMIGYTAVDMFADTTDEDDVVTTKAEHEAAYQATLDAKAAEANRKTRDDLIAATDFYALSDVALSTEMIAYRKALRDITRHANWPNLKDTDWPVI